MAKTINGLLTLEASVSAGDSTSISAYLEPRNDTNDQKLVQAILDLDLSAFAQATDSATILYEWAQDKLPQEGKEHAICKLARRARQEHEALYSWFLSRVESKFELPACQGGRALNRFAGLFWLAEIDADLAKSLFERLLDGSERQRDLEERAFFRSETVLSWLLDRRIYPQIADVNKNGLFSKAGRYWPNTVLTRTALFAPYTACKYILDKPTPMESDVLHMVIRRQPLHVQMTYRRRYLVRHPIYAPLTSYQRSQLLDLFLQRGADIDHLETKLENRISNSARRQAGCTPLQLAIALDDAEMAVHLMKRGARLDKLDADGLSALEMAGELSGSSKIEMCIALQVDQTLVELSRQMDDRPLALPR